MVDILVSVYLMSVLFLLLCWKQVYKIIEDDNKKQAIEWVSTRTLFVIVVLFPVMNTLIVVDSIYGSIKDYIKNNGTTDGDNNTRIS